MHINFCNLFLMSLFWCTFSAAMEPSSTDFLDKKLLSRSCKSARLLIPEIIGKNTLLSLKKDPGNILQKSIDSVKPLCPTDPALKKELEDVCSNVEKLFLQEIPSSTYLDMHTRLKDLIPDPRYSTFTLYKIYREALDLAYQKAEILKKTRQTEIVVYSILHKDEAMLSVLFEDVQENREKT